MPFEVMITRNYEGTVFSSWLQHMRSRMCSGTSSGTATNLNSHYGDEATQLVEKMLICENRYKILGAGPDSTWMSLQ